MLSDTQREILEKTQEEFFEQLSKGNNFNEHLQEIIFGEMFPVYGTVDIRKDFTVIDLRCGSALQSAFFANCNKYIGVDNNIALEYRFSPNYAEHYQMSIKEFIQQKLPELQQRGLSVYQTYAICSFEPDKDTQLLISETFPFIRIYGDTLVADRKPPLLNNYNCMRLIDELANHGVIQRDPNRRDNVIVYYKGDTENPEGWYSENIWTAAEDLLLDGDSQRLLINELNQTYELKHIDGCFMQKDFRTGAMSPVLERESLADEYPLTSRDIPVSGKKKSTAERETV